MLLLYKKMRPSGGVIGGDLSDLWGDLARCVADDFETSEMCPAPAPLRKVLPEAEAPILHDTSEMDELALTEEKKTFSRVSRRKRKDVGVIRRNGDTALVAAARRGATEAVRALLEAGAQVNATTRRGESALDAATDFRKLNAASALVRAKANVPVADDSLLRVATLAGDDALVTALLASGSPALLSRMASDRFAEPPLLQDDEEPGATSCLLLAVRHPLIAVLDAYVRHFREAFKQTQLDAPHGARRVTALMVAAANARRDDASAVHALLKAGTDFSAADSRGRTPLHRAAAADARAAVEALAEAARMKCRDDDGKMDDEAFRAFIDARELETYRTPLHCAAAAAACAATAALLAAGADATVRDAADATPLAIVALLQASASASKPPPPPVKDYVIPRAEAGPHPEAATELVVDKDAGEKKKSPEEDEAEQMATTIMSKEEKIALTRFELEAMTRAVADGDFDECISLSRRRNWPIDGSVEMAVEQSTATGDTPLVAAARRGDVEAVVDLLTVGKARVDARSASAESPLAVAASKGNLIVCAALLDAGARPSNELRDCGAQLLLTACRARDAHLVRKLLEVDKAYGAIETTPVYSQQGGRSRLTHRVSEPPAPSVDTGGDGQTTTFFSQHLGSVSAVSTPPKTTATGRTRMFRGGSGGGGGSGGPNSDSPSTREQQRLSRRSSSVESSEETDGRLSRPALRRALHAAASLADDDCVEAILSFAPSLSELYCDVSATATGVILGSSGSLKSQGSGGMDDVEPSSGDYSDCAYLTQFPSVGDEREPALLAACRANATTCVTALTRERGALRAALDDERRCALHHAAALDRASLIEKLCGEDASLVTCRDVRGATSLHAAAAAGAGAAIAALLRHGADATMADSKKRTPRDVAIIRGRFEAAAQLDAMAAAIDDGDFDECARLANAGNFPIDWRSSATGDTALVAAARRGAPDAVSRLLSCGASVDARSEIVTNSLTRNKQRVAVKEVGASDGSRTGVTPLGAAAKAGHLDVCAALLAAGAEPTELSDRAANLLVAAVVANEPELVDALLAKGASACAPEYTPEEEDNDDDGVGSLRHVGSSTITRRDSGESFVEDTSSSRGSQGGAFMVAVEVGSPEIVKSFIDRAVEPGLLDVEATHGPKKLNAMHAAAMRGRAEIVRALLSAGAKVDALDADGRSALHHAAQGDYDDVLRVLVSEGAHTRFTDLRGMMPVHVAEQAGATKAISALKMAESVIRRDRA